MEYRPFLEPMPTYGEARSENAAWFERYEWADEPVGMAAVCALLMVKALVGGPLAGVVVGVVALIFGSVFEVVVTISWCFAVLCALAAVGLLVYRVTVFPRVARRWDQQFDQAMATWRKRRLAHVTEWEQRLGWPPV